jgi:mono/diheme cytochrome c family protein
VNLNNGPDGALYIVDLHHGILQHRIFLTSYLRAQSESRGLESPIHLGRIYRVVPEGKNAKPVNLAKMTSAQLVENLSNGNGWVRDTAQRLLVERSEAGTIPLLKAKAGDKTSSLGQIHALWTLDGMGQLDQETVWSQLSSADPKVCAMAIRLSEHFLKTSDAPKWIEKLASLSGDSRGDVQLQLAFTLGESADPKAEQGMLAIAKNSSANVYVRDALLTGLYNRELEFLEKLIADKAWAGKKPGRAEIVSGLSRCIFYGRKTDDVNRVFELAAAASDWQRAALLDGIASTATPAAKGKKAPHQKELYFASEPAGFSALAKKQDRGTVAQLKKISTLVTWPGQPGYVPPPKIAPLTADEQKRFDAGKELFAASCAACHQLTGLGMEGLAPPLADSEWVLGPPARITRIVLHGLQGKIQVKGKTYEMEMPSLGVFDDEQIASLLTYIRREWEHGASPVDAAFVKKVRDETSGRNEAWTEAELLKVR